MVCVNVEPNITDYEKAHGEFSWEVPEEYNFAWDTVDRWARDRTKLALITVFQDGWSHEMLSYWYLSVQSKKFTNVLRELGVHKGDKVFVMLPNCSEFYIVTLGAIRMGALFMPTPTLSTSKDIRYRITRSEASVVVTTGAFAARVDEVIDELPTVKHRMVIDDVVPPGWLSYRWYMDRASRRLSPEDVGGMHAAAPVLVVP